MKPRARPAHPDRRRRVETEAQRTFLGREACEEMQGYLIGRPEPIERYFDLIGINVERRRYA